VAPNKYSFFLFSKLFSPKRLFFTLFFFVFLFLAEKVGFLPWVHNFLWTLLCSTLFPPSVIFPFFFCHVVPLCCDREVLGRYRQCGCFPDFHKIFKLLLYFLGFPHLPLFVFPGVSVYIFYSQFLIPKNLFLQNLP